MSYKTTEQKVKELKEHIDLWREAVEIIPSIKQVIQKFDGKVINKRLAEAIENITNKRVCASTNGHFIDITLKSVNSYSIFVTIMCSNLPKEYLTDGKRINAELINARLDETSNIFTKKATNAAIGLSQLEIYQAEIEKLKAYADYINNLIPFEIQAYLEMHVTIRTY